MLLWYPGLSFLSVVLGSVILINRRRLLQLGVATGVGLQSGPILSKNEEETSVSDGGPAVRAYNQLGRTGLNISDISFGSSQSSDPDLVRHARDRGVNYFDTAESYRFGTSEVAIGEGLSGVRDRVILASKTAQRSCGLSKVVSGG